jgi:hypothetical protein
MSGKYWRKCKSIILEYQLFIDFKKAYNPIKNEVLYNILLEFGIPVKKFGLIKMFLDES